MRPIPTWRKRKFRADYPRTPSPNEITGEVEKTKPWEVSLRIAQTLAAWFQVLGVIAAICGVWYGIQNNILTIKNETLTESNKTLADRNSDLDEQIAEKDTKLREMEDQISKRMNDALAAEAAAEDAKRLLILQNAKTRDSERLLRETRRRLVVARVVDNFLSLSMDDLNEAVRRANLARSDVDQEPTSNTDTGELGELAIPDWAGKLRRLLNELRENPARIDVPGSEVELIAALQEVSEMFEANAKFLICESPDLDQWSRAFKAELARTERMQDLAEESTLASYAAANKWSSDEVEQVRKLDWWKREAKSAKKAAGGYWKRQVNFAFSEKWRGAFEACRKNFWNIFQIADNKVQPRQARDSELEPPEPLPELKWR